jgi:uncharacterized protein (TIRG00374 family)
MNLLLFADCLPREIYMTNNKKSGFFFPAKIAVATVIIYYIFKIIPITEVIESIAGARYIYIIAGLVTMLATVVASATRLKRLTDMQGMSFSTCRIAKINLVARFYGLLLPGYLAGGVIRWYKLSQDNKKRAEALAAIGFSRINYTTVLVIVGFSFLIIDMPHVPPAFTVLILLSVFMSLSVLYFIAFNSKVFHLLQSLNLDKIKFLPVWLRDKISKLIVAMLEYQGLSRRTLCFVTGASLVENILGILSVYLLAISLHIEITFYNLGWIRTVIAIIISLPISVSGIGIREGGLIMLLERFNVPGSEAVALSFLIFGCSVFVGLIGGLMEAGRLLLVRK